MRISGCWHRNVWKTSSYLNITRWDKDSSRSCGVGLWSSSVKLFAEGYFQQGHQIHHWGTGSHKSSFYVLYTFFKPVCNSLALIIHLQMKQINFPIKTIYIFILFYFYSTALLFRLYLFPSLFVKLCFTTFLLHLRTTTTTTSSVTLRLVSKTVEL